MSGTTLPPPGFTQRRDGSMTLYVDASLEDDLRARGLFNWDGWERALAAAGSGATGRGASAVVAGPGGTRWRLKRMRRGGITAPLWRDRYPSPARLVGTLAISATARQVGVPTARPVALLVDEGALGLVRGVMAFEEIERSQPLAGLAVEGAVTNADLTAAIGAVRTMHDRGIVHPDLNLGNVLVRRRAGDAPEAFVIDFDRAYRQPGPVPFSTRQAGLRRLERSCAKLTGRAGPMGPGSEDLWYSIYAGQDSDLIRRLASGRALGRLSLAFHRLGWKRIAP